MTRPNLHRYVILLAFAAGAWFGAIRCASPQPSSIALGDGPLALAEQRRRLTAEQRERDREREESPETKPPKPQQTQGQQADEQPSEDESPATRDGGAADAGGAPDAGNRPAPAGPIVFAGMYIGNDVTTYRLNGMPDRTERDPKARTRVERDGSSHIRLTLVNSANGNDICTLRAKVSGARAEVERGQKCFEQSSDVATASAEVTHGRAEMKKSRLILDLDLDFEMQAGGRTITGKLDYHFEGKREK